ncbi:GTP-binding protein [Streptomyces decoyicus]
MPKGLLSTVVGNTPAARGLAVDTLVGAAPRAVVLAVSIHCRDAGCPVVQRFITGPGVPQSVSQPMAQVATGDPVVILRQDLLAIRRTARPPHLVLALPGELDLLPFLVELRRPRIGASALGDHYVPAPVVAGLDPAALLAELGCVHRAACLWDGTAQTSPLTPAEIAARRMEAAHGVIVPAPPSPTDRRTDGVAALAHHLNPSATLVQIAQQPPTAAELPPPLLRPVPDALEEWRARLEPVTVAPSRPGTTPAAVVTWRSAGPHMELHEADRWLEPGDESAWRGASPQRRTLASWFWHDYDGECRNTLTFTGADLDRDRLCSALDAALLDDRELSLGRDGWAAFPDPLLGDFPL